MKLTAPFVFLLLLAGCATGPLSLASGFPPPTVTEPAYPTVAACLTATGESSSRPGEESRACVRLDVVNAFSPVLVLQALEIELDGTLVFARQEPSGGRGELDFTRAFTVTLGQTAPGQHELRLAAWLTSNPREAPSLHGTTVGLCARHLFSVAAGGGISVTAFLTDEGDKHTAATERIHVGYAEDRDAKHPGKREPQNVGAAPGSPCPTAARP